MVQLRGLLSGCCVLFECRQRHQQGKSWIDKAIAMSERPTYYYRRLVYAKAGDKKGAIAAAEQSMALAQDAGNDYVTLNNKSLAEWRD